MWQENKSIILTAIIFLLLATLARLHDDYNKQRPTACYELACTATLGVDNGSESYQPTTNYPHVEKYVYEQMGEAGVRLCRCESGCNPNAVSPSGKYRGIFQFDRPTWSGNCVGDVFDYKAQTDCTKKLIDKGQIGRWPTCRWRM